MRQDNRLPRVLHALLHLSDMKDPATSEQLAGMLNTNAAVVRRTMAGLRDQGILTSIKGHGGGWQLARPLEKITLAEIYQALGAPTLFALGCGDEESQCLMEKAANTATARALQLASETFITALSSVTMADLAVDFEKRLAELGLSPDNLHHFADQHH
ncbi:MULTISPECIES: Rrf2 family transcriptional regulator [unclassified Thalassospira]|uniref:RrF2 family transcriptional regulator n=1 Tax=unclassified Thalassospira TaxID=2648997 RepID=UPI0007AD71A4|nr:MULTISPECIES: Rrf2 family transcriptional regulator [unclassified Thalassospira]KZB69400.1 transcriptional regulator [Thalassospira sp. MCCC 1A02491]MBO6773652.1 Rrf2 family transcriptional regulator [Thalassospira sp.]|tara:strand:- start:96 stop:569 length:474 start_codon:yes stop_codon:yes gene_type:complete